MRNLFSRTVIYISVGLHLLMLHASEKWAAVEYSTSPPQEEEKEVEEEVVVGMEMEMERRKGGVQTMHFQVLKWRGLQLQLKIKRPACPSNGCP